VRTIAALLLCGALATIARAAPPQAKPDDAAPPQTAADSPEAALESIANLKQRIKLAPTDDAQRQAADELIRVRRGLLASGRSDARWAVWLADHAEDCFTVVLPAGNDVDRALFGIAGPETRRRVREVAREMLLAAEDADAAAQATLARKGPERPTPQLVAQLEQVERARRIPLLRSLAEILNTEAAEFDAAKRRAMGEAALSRIDALLTELDDRTASIVGRYAGLAAARLGDERRANQYLSLSRQKAAGDETMLTLADLASLRAAGLLRGPGPAADAAGVLEGSGSLARQLAIAELECRLRRQSGGEPGADGAASQRPWTAPLAAVIRRSAPKDAPATRDAVLARLAAIERDGTPLPERDPLCVIASADQAVDRGESTATMKPQLEALTNEPGVDPSIQAAALRTLTRIDLAGEHWSDAADRSIRLASEHAGDAASTAAIALAIRVSRELDRGADGQDPLARGRLEKAVAIGASHFSDHPDFGAWQLERQVLAAEALAEHRPCELESTPPSAAIAADSDAVRALRERLDAAQAWMAAERGDHQQALECLARSGGATLGPTAAARRLSAKITALSALAKDLAEDPELKAASQSNPALVAGLAARRMRGMLPGNRWPVDAVAADGAGAASARALAQTLKSCGTKDPMAWLDMGDLLRLVGACDEALPAYERSLQLNPAAREALLGKAECLFTRGDEASLGQAMSIYKQLLAGREYESDPARREHAWWICQLRQLQILRAAGRWDEKAALRLARLKALDASLGSPECAAAFAKAASS
jgi:tetratricopeptide (TPR) repeat protein